MRVVFVRGHYDLAGDAASRALQQLADALSDRGANVRLMTYVETGLAGSRLPASVRRAAFMLRATRIVARLPRESIVVTLEEPTGLGLVVRLGNALRRVTGRGQLAHVSWLMDLFTLQRLNLSRLGKAEARPFDRLRMQLDRQALARADRIVVLGACMQTVAESVFGRGQVTVVPIWQPTHELAGGDGSAVRSSWGIPSDHTVVLYSGHLNYRHAVQSIPQVAAQMVDDDLHFVFVGDGERFEDLAASVDLLGHRNLHFWRRAAGTSIRDILAAGDVHLVALEDEATGTCVPSKTYAAMAAKRPVVYLGSALGQAAADVIDAAAGFVLSPDDVTATTDALRRLHRDESLRRRLGGQGWAFFRAKRDLPVVVERWWQLLAGLAEKDWDATP